MAESIKIMKIIETKSGNNFMFWPTNDLDFLTSKKRIASTKKYANQTYFGDRTSSLASNFFLGTFCIMTWHFLDLNSTEISTNYIFDDIFRQV